MKTIQPACRARAGPGPRSRGKREVRTPTGASTSPVSCRTGGEGRPGARWVHFRGGDRPPTGAGRRAAPAGGATPDRGGHRGRWEPGEPGARGGGRHPSRPGNPPPRPSIRDGLRQRPPQAGGAGGGKTRRRRPPPATPRLDPGRLGEGARAGQVHTQRGASDGHERAVATKRCGRGHSEGSTAHAPQGRGLQGLCWGEISCRSATPAWQPPRRSRCTRCPAARPAVCRAARSRSTTSPCVRPGASFQCVSSSTCIIRVRGPDTIGPAGRGPRAGRARSGPGFAGRAVTERRTVHRPPGPRHRPGRRP